MHWYPFAAIGAATAVFAWLAIRADERAADALAKLEIADRKLRRLDVTLHELWRLVDAQAGVVAILGGDHDDHTDLCLDGECGRCDPALDPEAN